MKQIYNVQRMTYSDYCNYMGGGHDFSVENLHIEAESPEEAVKMAEAEGYMVNKNYVKTVAELEAEEVARKAYIDAEIAKEKAAKARKAAREAEKAEAMGMTVEEYKTYKKKVALLKKLPKEITEVENEIKRLTAEIERKKRLIETLKTEVGEV